MDPGSGLGYNLGLAGGILMLGLFAYPARKRLAVLRGVGHTRTWFRAHFWLAIVSVTLVLAHSKLEPRSVNATLALGGTVALTASGLAGRYLGARYPTFLALWSTVHVPLSYLLALIVVAHVVAAHMY